MLKSLNPVTLSDSSYHDLYATGMSYLRMKITAALHLPLYQKAYAICSLDLPLLIIDHSCHKLKWFVDVVRRTHTVVI